MKTRSLILLCFIFAHCTYGTDSLEQPQRSKPMWFRIACARPNPKTDQDQATKLQLKKLRKKTKEHLKTPLPKVLILEKAYDFFGGVPKKLYRFMGNFLNFPNFQDGTEIITSPGWFDRRGHVTEGRIGNIKVILKRDKHSNDPNERKKFYPFMDAVKEKLRELAAIENDDTLSEEEKKSRTQYLRSQLIGLGNITPIVGIANFRRFDESSPETFIDETIEISLKASGRTLYDCIEKKLPPYDTPRGVPRNQNIAIKLLLQLTRTVLALHNCGYIHDDLRLPNIMIAENGSSFALKLIDWDYFEQVQQTSDLTKNVREMCAIFASILLGKQHLMNKYCPRFRKKETDIKASLKAHLHRLKKAGIYSRKTIAVIMKLFRDLLLGNDEKKPDAETIMLKLKELLIDNEPQNTGSEENNNYNDEPETNGKNESENENDDETVNETETSEKNENTEEKLSED
ncbi:MAG: hypothetical protein LBQ03_00075 [Puniceicoccales bacterium]|jgi:hypothetical protein|nr:hypothetical protein [Puniceicoccales bacterium]